MTKSDNNLALLLKAYFNLISSHPELITTEERNEIHNAINSWVDEEPTVEPNNTPVNNGINSVPPTTFSRLHTGTYLQRIPEEEEEEEDVESDMDSEYASSADNISYSDGSTTIESTTSPTLDEPNSKQQTKDTPEMEKSIYELLQEAQDNEYSQNTSEDESSIESEEETDENLNLEKTIAQIDNFIENSSIFTNIRNNDEIRYILHNSIEEINPLFSIVSRNLGIDYIQLRTNVMNHIADDAYTVSLIQKELARFLKNPSIKQKYENKSQIVNQERSKILSKNGVSEDKIKMTETSAKEQLSIDLLTITAKLALSAKYNIIIEIYQNNQLIETIKPNSNKFYQQPKKIYITINNYGEYYETIESPNDIAYIIGNLPYQHGQDVTPLHFDHYPTAMPSFEPTSMNSYYGNQPTLNPYGRVANTPENEGCA